jgi:transcriptional regulator of acetoin/glycerol metabolism
LAVAALAVGAGALKLEEPFLPAKGTLLRALAEARDAAREREARSAMAHAMLRIREVCALGLGANAAPSPELWLLHPTRVITVNSAGYLHERNAEMPDGIFDIALGETSSTLRTGVLKALEVRRADLRPYLAWLEQRGALFATVIAESNDPDGLIVVPAGARTEELSLEEAQAAKRLADAFVAVSQAESAKVRHLQRERDLKAEIDKAEDANARLQHALALDVGRNALAATRLARPATVGIYSAASRMAYEALERRVQQDAPAVLVARAGTDPVPFVARAHLSGPRKDGPFVVVDATSSREHDVERWTDERTSPLALADRGLLFLVDGAALPRDVQIIVARAVAERRPPWERATPLDIVLALSATEPVDVLVEANRLTPELAGRFESSEPIVLPGLRDRAEDLRSIVADRLAREGLRVHGRPTGIDMAAFSLLMEYDFEAEDAELAAIVTKLVARAQNDVVRAADVRALGLAAPESGASTQDKVRLRD